MQLSAIILARVLGFIETADLDARGKVFNPDFVQEVVKRYKFQKFPKTIEEFNEANGVVFEEERNEKKHGGARKNEQRKSGRLLSPLAPALPPSGPCLGSPCSIWLAR